MVSVQEQVGKEESPPTKRESRLRAEKRVGQFRLLVFVAMAMSGVLLGLLSFFLLHQEEVSSFESEYNSLADDFIHNVQFGLQVAHYSTVSAAGMISVLYKGQWPYVHVDGFEELYQQASAASYVYFSALSPIVEPDGIDEFNAFTSNYNDYKIRDFVTHQEYNESSGYFGSNYDENKENLILPGTNVAPPLFEPWTNLDAASFNGANFVDSISCLHKMNFSNTSNVFCSNLTPIVDSLVDWRFLGATVFIVVPVVDDNKVVAFMSNAIMLEFMLKDLAPPNMPGMICVIETMFSSYEDFSSTYTFEISGSGVKNLGVGDLHDSGYNHMRHSTEFSLDTDPSTNSTQYRMSFYPTPEFRRYYQTSTPAFTATIYVAFAIVLMVIFFTYDRAVLSDSLAREIILATKKNFVRYISHEIRTPLNAVLLGLDVLHSAEKSDRSECQPLCSARDIYNDISEIADEVRSGAAIAVGVLNDLLDYDRLDMSRMKITPQALPAAKYLRGTLSALRRQLVEKEDIPNLSFRTELFPAHSEGETGADGESKMADAFFSSGSSDQPVMRVKDLFLVGDIHRLTQVIRHMISNALKYVPSDGRVSVKVTWKEEGSGKQTATRRNQQKSKSDNKDMKIFEDLEDSRRGVVIISVTDNGPGISKELLNEIFSDDVDFDTRLGKSKGLGLCIAKQIIQLHYGRMWAVSSTDESGEGETGSSFIIELPAYSLSEERRQSISISLPRHLSEESGSNLNTDSQPDESAAVQSLTQPEGASKPQSRSGSTSMANKPISITCQHNRILVVDDSGPSRKIVCKMLARHGFDTVQAVDGVECLQKVQEESPNDQNSSHDLSPVAAFDCILLDSEMPNMSGPTAAKRLRALGYKVPIIGLTGNVLNDDVNNFLEHGADHVMFKPFNIESFKLMIKRDSPV